MKKLNKYLLTSALFLCFSGLALAQPEYPGDGTPVKLPDKVMQQVIGRILVKTFKPVSTPKTIDILSNGVKLSWLPRIRNIKFRLVRDGETEGEIYFFTKPEVRNKTYMIGFGFGDPECGATGDSWHFRLVKQKLRLWQSGGFGSGCSGTTGTGSAGGSISEN